MATRYPVRTKDTSSTTGTGTYTLADATAAGYRNLTRAVTDGDLASGDTVHYIVVDTTVTGGPKLCEVCSGVWDNTAKTLTRATVYQPNGAAVSWGAGTRDIFIIDNPQAFLTAANNLSDVASVATARASLLIDPASQSGGTSTKVVRYSAANTWTDASQADTAAQLTGLMMVVSSVYYPPGTLVTGLSGLTAGSVYYLSTAGGVTTSAPTPSGSVRLVVVGKAVSTTSLLFAPQTPIGG